MNSSEDPASISAAKSSLNLVPHQAAAAGAQKEVSARTIPLSFAQQRFFFLQELDTNASYHIVPVVWRFQGKLNISALQKALNAVVQRHEGLRATFVLIDRVPMQVVHEQKQPEFSVEDLLDIPPGQRTQTAQDHVSELLRRPFDLRQGPLLRSLVLQVEEDEYVFALAAHHIICDGWSIRIIGRDLAAFYNSFSLGRQVTLPPLSAGYAEYCGQQQELAHANILESQLSFWKERLAGSAMQELPASRPNASRETMSGAVYYLTIDGVQDEIQQFCKKQRVSLFMLLLATLDVLLYRYTGQEDVIVGAPIAGRPRTEMEGIVGCFINTLTLRTDLSGKPSFRKLLARVRETAFDAYANQDVPLERVIHALNPERDLGRSELFRVLLEFHNEPRLFQPFTGLVAQAEKFDRGGANFPLTFRIQGTRQGLLLILEYSTELFDPGIVHQLAGHFSNLLAGVLESPETHINDFKLLSNQERRQVIEDWNNSGQEYPDKCAHELVEEQAARNPEAIALICNGHSLTYAQLNNRANQLASFLMSAGVASESLAGICLERSVEMVVAVLAVLKAGAAYVPLDPEYPFERLSYILTDANAKVLLVHQQTRHIAVRLPARAICLDQESDAIAGHPVENPLVKVHPGNAAYLIYTSGSTGRPNGVLVEHRNLVNHLWSMRQRPGLKPHDRFLAVTTLSFDIAGMELLLPLISGAQLLVGNRDLLLDGKALAQIIETEKPTALQATPTTWRVLLDSGWKGNQQLTAMIGGEAFSRELAARLHERTAELWNMYGPTETTIWSCIFRFVPGEGPVPIGEPVGNTDVYVLNSDGELVPPGVAGELYIGGVGVARGYHDRPALTAERFVPNLFAQQPGQRFYRTGDLVKWRPDGTLEFLRRIDEQVKIRGRRIELGEIQSVLETSPAIKQAVVTVREDEPGDKRLVAYVTKAGNSGPSPETLRDLVRMHLPDYMVPSYFVVLDQLPLTPNGKVNRKALPAPDENALAKSGTEYVSPRNEMEQFLSELWSEALKLKNVSVRDSFFDLGGHSLLALQIVSRIQATLHLDLQLRTLFNNPTIEGLARVLRELQRQGSTVTVEPVEKAPRDSNLFLSFDQEGRLFFEWWLSRKKVPYAPFQHPVARVLKGKVNVKALEDAFNEICRRHEILRTSFARSTTRQAAHSASAEPAPAQTPHARSGLFVQTIHPQVHLTLSVQNVESFPEVSRESEAGHLGALFLKEPFHYATPPLIRALLIKINEQKHLLVISLHHLVADGWSFGILDQELWATYSAFVKDLPCPLPEVPIQYVDFTCWQRKRLSGGFLEKTAAYWRHQYRDFESIHPSCNHLSFARSDSEEAPLSPGTETLVLDPELVANLRTFARKNDSTVYTVFIAALTLILHLYLDKQRVGLWAHFANRVRPEFEKLIGWFSTYHLLVIDFAHDSEMLDLLDQTREVILEAHAHQELPFAHVWDFISQDPSGIRSLSRMLGEAHVAFDFLVPETAESNVEGLVVQPVGVPEATADGLRITAVDTGEKINLTARYRADKLAGAGVRQMLADMHTIVERTILNPYVRFSSLLRDYES